MRLVRLTTCALVGLLLIQGSGALSILHELTHHPVSDKAAALATGASCGHSHAASSAAEFDDQRSLAGDEHDPAPPVHPQNDGDCSICLGLTGLHLIAPPSAPDLPRLALFTEPRPCAPVTRVDPVRLDARASRAPPAC